MENGEEPTKRDNNSLADAKKDVNENRQEDLAQENLGNEPEEQPDTDPNNPYRMEGFDDKRPEDGDIEKGWTVASNTSRNPQDISEK